MSPSEIDSITVPKPNHGCWRAEMGAVTAWRPQLLGVTVIARKDSFALRLRIGEAEALIELDDAARRALIEQLGGTP